MPNRLPYVHLTRSTVVHRKKCLLHGVIVTPDGSNNSYADIYDGETTRDDLVARVRCVSTTSNPLIFPTPILMQKGLYISFEASLSSVVVFSEPVEE